MSVTDGSEKIDYQAIRCAGLPEPPVLPSGTGVQVMRILMPTYIILQECSDYRRSHLFVDLNEMAK